MKSRGQERIEYRLVCALQDEHEWHRPHAWMISPKNGKTAEKRSELLANRNSDPVYVNDPVPANRGCVPLRIEGHYVSEWTTDFDRLDGLIE